MERLCRSAQGDVLPPLDASIYALARGFTWRVIDAPEVRLAVGRVVYLCPPSTEEEICDVHDCPPVSERGPGPSRRRRLCRRRIPPVRCAVPATGTTALGTNPFRTNLFRTTVFTRIALDRSKFDTASRRGGRCRGGRAAITGAACLRPGNRGGGGQNAGRAGRFLSVAPDPRPRPAGSDTTLYAIAGGRAGTGRPRSPAGLAPPAAAALRAGQRAGDTVF